MLKTVADRLIDVRGKSITTYILHEVVNTFSAMPRGESVELITDNFEPIEGDLRAWCRMTGHTFRAVERAGDHQRFVIEKGEARPSGRSLSVVLSNPGLEQLLSPLGFALAAALSGAKVYIYFQGPAVRVLKRRFKGSLEGLSRPFSGIARKGMAETGHVPPQEKLRQLQELGARFYACGPSMDHFGVTKADFAFDGVTVSEYVAFMEQMERADIHIFLQ
jgi:predicted peroxiredoxin/TusA-related sulfurtransferase